MKLFVDLDLAACAQLLKMNFELNIIRHASGMKIDFCAYGIV
jgi:hypothetical protein